MTHPNTPTEAYDFVWLTHPERHPIWQRAAGLAAAAFNADAGLILLPTDDEPLCLSQTTRPAALPTTLIQTLANTPDQYTQRHDVSAQHSLLSTPLWPGQASGSLCVMADAARPWSTQDSDLLQLLASNIRNEIALHYALERCRAHEAQQAQVIRDLDAYGYVVAHELKNPIAALIGFMDLMAQSATLSQPDHELLTYMRCSADQLVTIIESLLSFGVLDHTDEIETAQVNMQALVMHAISRLQPLLNLRHATVNIVTPLPSCITHAAWVEMVWTNYISNGVKYGGRPPHLRIGSETHTGYICYWVEDNGPGLPPDQQAHIFEAFTRVGDIEVQGHGLGLYLVQRIITRLGGTVGMENVAEGGSRFWFTLPTA